jgi:two-component system, OmpR family, response regulator CpxR
MCVSVEMLWRQFAANFSSSERTQEPYTGFGDRWDSRIASELSAIDSGGTLHPAARALGFNSPATKINFTFAGAGCPARCFENQNGSKKMRPKRTILCVDRNEQTLSIRKVMLETRGYRVVACTGAEEALQTFQKGGVDLVLTDLAAPGLDGEALVEEIKKLQPQVPVILLPSKARFYDRDTRADVFLPKGMYAPAELLERIRLLLVRKRGPKGPHPRPPAGPPQISAA